MLREKLPAVYKRISRPGPVSGLLIALGMMAVGMTIPNIALTSSTAQPTPPPPPTKAAAVAAAAEESNPANHGCDFSGCPKRAAHFREAVFHEWCDAQGGDRQACGCQKARFAYCVTHAADPEDTLFADIQKQRVAFREKRAEWLVD